MGFRDHTVLPGKRHSLSNGYIKFVLGTSCTAATLQGFDPVKTYPSKQLAFGLRVHILVTERLVT